MNFIQQTSTYDYEGKARGYQRTYEYRNRQAETLWTCDVFGSCISAPTIFVPEMPGVDSFTMTAKGKFLNATYFLDGEDGVRFATITRKGRGFRWKILDENGAEVFRVVEPSSWKKALLRDIFQGVPDGFAVIRNDTFAARIAKEDIVGTTSEEPKNRVGKFLGRMMSKRAMTLRVEDESLPQFDARTSAAVMTLLTVHDIAGAASSG